MTEEKAKDKQLVTIVHYSKLHNIDRRKVYRLIEAGKLTRYRGLGGEPMLDPEENSESTEDVTVESVPEEQE